MDSVEPLVTVGVPLYNSEAYLESALDSLLAQTFQRFEIVISDNGSSDKTEEICLRYAARDQRVRYFRHAVNRGATWNHNFVVSEARGLFFRWHHYDDICEPLHLERCVEALENNPLAVLAYPRTTLIDAAGRITGAYDDKLALGEESPHARLKHFLRDVYYCNPVLGLFRMNALRRTALLGAYVSADHVLLAEFAMQGPWIEIQESLFKRRVHPAKSTAANRTARDRVAWFDPRLRSGVFFLPNHRLFLERLKAVWRAQIDAREKLLCAWTVIMWQSQFAARLSRKKWSRRRTRLFEWLGWAERAGKVDNGK